MKYLKLLLISQRCFYFGMVFLLPGIILQILSFWFEVEPYELIFLSIGYLSIGFQMLYSHLAARFLLKHYPKIKD